MQMLRLCALALVGIALSLGGSFAQPSYTVCPQGPPTCPFKKISEAIQAAEPGSTITIGPGTYSERLLIDKSLTLRGAGRTATTLQARSEDFAITVRGTAHVTIEGIRISGPREEFFDIKAIQVTDQAQLFLYSALLERGKFGILVEGEAIAQIYNTAINEYFDTAVTARGKAQLTVGYSVLRKNIRDFSLYVSAQGLIDENEIIGGLIELSGDAQVIFRNNRLTFAPPVQYEKSQLRLLNSETRLYGNQFFSYKIDVFGTTQIVMKGNKMQGQGISFYDASSGVIVGNEIIQANLGIFVRSSGSFIMERNSIGMNDGRGIELGHAQAMVRDNKIWSNNKDGLMLFGNAQAEIVGNYIHNNQGWGIATLTDMCYELKELKDYSNEDLFQGTVTGFDNELKDNKKGDLCGVPESLKKP
jgi:parallel beta-helix repeat protein